MTDQHPIHGHAPFFRGFVVAVALLWGSAILFTPIALIWIASQ